MPQIDLEKFGFRMVTPNQWYLGLQKEREGLLYLAWTTVIRRDIGWVVDAFIIVDDEKVLAKVLQELKRAFDELRRFGYKEPY
jgi:hypothetical protein